jgi:hypothetical protein
MLIGDLMARITQADMIANRKCGLKYYDKAVALVGHKAIVDSAIDIFIEFPNVWGPGWASFSWAFGNAVHDIINNRNNISQTYNLKDVLCEADIAYIQSKLPQMVGFPPDTWPRK